jgi:hypothetical protein
MAKIRETASSLLENWVRVTKFCLVFLFDELESSVHYTAGGILCKASHSVESKSRCRV